MKEILKYILGIIAAIIVLGLLILGNEKAQGDGDIVVIAGKKYLKEVDYVGNGVYQVDYFPIEDSTKVN